MGIAFEYGLLMTLLDSGWWALAHRWEWPPPLTWMAAVAIIVVGLSGAMRDKRADMGGPLTYTDALMSGLYVTVAYGVLDSVATYVFLEVYEPPRAGRSPTTTLLLGNGLVILVLGTLASAILGAVLSRRPGPFKPEAALPQEFRVGRLRFSPVTFVRVGALIVLGGLLNLLFDPRQALQVIWLGLALLDYGLIFRRKAARATGTAGTGTTAMGGVLLAILCPPLYLARRKRWVACAVSAVFWILAVWLGVIWVAAMSPSGALAAPTATAGWAVIVGLAWLLAIGCLSRTTLPTVLVVLLIVAALVAVALVFYRDVGTKARLAADQETMNRIRSAIAAYARQHGRLPPDRATVEGLIEPRYGTLWICSAQDWTYDPATGTTTLRANDVASCKGLQR